MSPHTNGSFTLPDATRVDECDVPEGMTLPSYRACRQNRALHRLHRDPELRRAQLWTVGVPNVELDALLEQGAIACEPLTDTFRLTPAGEQLLASRGWGPTYTNGGS
jgi:hypothetical protein